jgi:hypothetical protein
MGWQLKIRKGSRWGVFPSAAVAWRISEEDFMSSASSWLSNLKLRLSYGLTGNMPLWVHMRPSRSRE